MANPNTRRQVAACEFRRLVSIASACADGPSGAMKLARIWAKRISTYEAIGPDVRLGRVPTEDRQWLTALAAPAHTQTGERA